MMSRHLSTLSSRTTSLRNLLRYRSQAVTAQFSVEDSSSDINNLKIDENYHGFQVKDIQDVAEFNIKVVQLLHEKTKANYIHLFRNDNNNVFSINFRTTPRNSTGLPHILEHLVLCGSELYPIRDPFFKMLNRSLATFMNAMTGSDFTIYPFSTLNYADYLNLQKIYLDAVFNPRLELLDFMQEGWRLENENPEDINSKLIIKGVVYNEMKGSFSEKENILMQKLQNLILPDHTYGVISGGDPIKIPDLTWNDLKTFHSQHYHPSNAKFYSYGNFPVMPTLKYLDEVYLSKHKAEDTTHTIVPSQQRWSQPQKEHIVCHFDNMQDRIEKQNTISISYAMSDVNNAYETFLLQFITNLLVRGPNSPFYKSMIEPNFSGGFTPSTGYDKQPRDGIFTIGLQGVKKDDFEKVTALFNKTIEDVINHGFESKHIESMLHQYELNIKHETSNFGLGLLFELTPILNHGGDIVNALKVNGIVEKLRKEMQSDPKYLQKVVEKYFKNNNHRLILTMSADKDYETKQVAKEQQLILEKTKSLSSTDKQNIYNKALELLESQKTPMDTNLLPTLQIDDIKNDVERFQHEKMRFGPVETQINYANTNGITYFKAIINTSKLTLQQQMLLPLFCNIVTNMGTQHHDYREFDNLVNQKTAGLNFDIHIADSLFQLHLYEPGLFLSSYCLDKNVDDMWNLWEQIFNTYKFNNLDRFKMLVQLYITNLTHGIADSGHIYAMQAASGLVSGAGYQKELLTGLQHIVYMKGLLKTSNYFAILLELKNIAGILFDTNNLRCSLNIHHDNKSNVIKSFEKFIGKLPHTNIAPTNVNAYSTTKVWTPTNAVNCLHHVLNAPVYFCSKAVLTAPYTNPDYGKLRVLATLLSAKYLHPELREKQGAYGGGARLSPDGSFTFYSYRDPHHFKTIDIFDNSNLWFHNELNNITAQDILEAKLGVFKSVDAPIPPSSKGINEFARRLTPDILQQHRSEIMAVDRAGLENVCEKYLNNKNYSLSSKVILGPKSDNLKITERRKELWTVLENK